MEEGRATLCQTRDRVVCLQEGQKKEEKKKREKKEGKSEACPRNVAFLRGTSIGWCSSISRFVVRDVTFSYGSVNTRGRGWFRRRSLSTKIARRYELVQRQREGERSLSLFYGDLRAGWMKAYRPGAADVKVNCNHRMCSSYVRVFQNAVSLRNSRVDPGRKPE